MALEGRHHKFELGEQVGTGGFGAVYRGTLVETGQVVAIKMPRSPLPPDQVPIFLREAELAQKVDSSRAVRVIDWGTSPPFIAMEFVDAPTLAQAIEDKRASSSRWAESELVSMSIELAKSLQDITVVLVHRDVSPRNVFLLADAIKIADFGLSKHIDESTRTLTFKDAATIEYVSPERIASARADHRSDQYSLGVIIFELATLERPFTGSDDEILGKHLYVEPPRLSDQSPPFSRAFSAVVARMLEKRPEHRYQDWPALIAALTEAMSTQVARPANPLAAEIAREAALQLDAVRAAALRAQQLEDERKRLLADRTQLLTYWISDLHRRTNSIASEINQQLDNSAVHVSKLYPDGPEGLRQFHVSFLDKHIDIALGPLPLDAPDGLRLWGYGILETNVRSWTVNFLVNSEPPPYGQLIEVDLLIPLGPMVPQDEPLDRNGGRYRRPGPGAAVGLDARAILSQHELKRVMGVVQWQENPCDFDAMITEAIRTLIQHAAAPKPEQPRPNSRRRGIYDDQV